MGGCNLTFFMATAIIIIVALSQCSETKAFVSRPNHALLAIHGKCKTQMAMRSNIDDNRSEQIKKAMAVLSLSFAFFASPVLADGQTKDFKLPPIDFSDKNRCVLNSSSMGQANAARDKLYDLRECKLSGVDGRGFDLSGVIMTRTDVSNAKFEEAQFSKAYLHDSNFDGADFTNGVVDRASFKGSSLRGAVFQNAVLTGTSFEDADLENVDFTDSYIGNFDLRNLCKNPTLKGENAKTGADTRFSAGCK